MRVSASTLLSVLALPPTALSAGYGKTAWFGGGGRTPHDFRRLAAELELHALDVADEPLYPVHTLAIPVDHFHGTAEYEPHTNATFENRYWFDASHYEPGGPVIILQGGETDGAGRLPFLHKGIVAQLAEATHGIGVIFEHRYYGDSFPTDDLSTANLRFLTTEQAMADEAYFASNIRFPGLEHLGDLTAKTTPYISYGGSYAGAFSAFLRVQYPDIFWGAISSSGVTEAVYDYWEYASPVTDYGPRACIAAQQLFTDMVDKILIGKNDSALTAELKATFNFPNVTRDQDWAWLLFTGVGQFQSLNWDPAVSDDAFYDFCDTVTSHDDRYDSHPSKRHAAAFLLEASGYKPNATIVTQLLNFIGWLNVTHVAPCAAEGNSQDACFSNSNATFYAQDDLAQYQWRSWAYQYCDQWGYLITGSGVPEGQLGVVSRTIDLNYTSTVCREAFNITRPSRIEETNKFGGYGLAAPRLAFIDGEWDPWRPATPHALHHGAPPRNSTLDQPFILIARSLHHYDENGVFENQTRPDFPPAAVVDTQVQEREFVQAWVEEWHVQRGDVLRTQ